MDMLSGNELKSLMQKQIGICVSIYMPTVRKGAETQQNFFKRIASIRDKGYARACAGIVRQYTLLAQSARRVCSISVT